jgi:hypothetical protein
MEDNYKSYKIAKQRLINKYSNIVPRLRRASKNADSFVTIDNYLDTEFSLGYLANPDKINYLYTHWENVNDFIKILIKNIKFDDVVCIPDTVTKYYNSNGIARNIITYYVNDNKLVIPEKIIDAIQRCNNKRFIYFNLDIYGQHASHANMIIIDLHNKTVERYEPHGKFRPHEKESAIIERELDDKFKILIKYLGLNKYKYIPPTKLSPPVGLQRIADAYEGMCVTYCLIYLQLRIMNPDVKQMELVNYLKKKKSTKLIEIILKYASYVEKELKKNKKEIIKERNDLYENKPKELYEYIIIDKFNQIEKDRL